MKEVKFEEHGFRLHLKNEEEFVSHQIYKKLKLLHTSRSLALTSLLVLSKNKTGKISAFDGFAGLGMAPLQWASLLNDEQIDISINVKSVMRNVFEDEEKIPQALKRCKIFYEDTNVLLHQKTFDFIYLAPLLSPMQYLEAALRSINNNGIIVLTICDLPDFINCDPEATYALYGSTLYPTEYITEMNARTVILNMVRAAAKFGKALDVKSCSVSNEAITVVCEVRKDTKLVSQCSKLIHHLVHCKESRQWRFVDQNKYLKSIDKANELLSCKNKKLNTVLLLGPLYSGTILDTKFIFEQCKVLYKIAYGTKTLHLFKNLLFESLCLSWDLVYNEVINIFIIDKKDLSKFDKAIEWLTTNHGWSMVVDKAAMYFDVQARVVPGSWTPKCDTLVKRLRKMGYFARKSTFGARFVRTNAILNKKVVYELYRKKR